MRTPTIAAVAGHALGGGCELAMMCDLLIAADTAKFGQPEIKLGVLPGMGGSQRLTRAIGKAKAMDLILTGRTIDAAEAERSGLVSRVVPADDLLTEAKAVATTISQMSRSASRMAKEAVNRAFESTLAEGLLYERRLFHSAFATDDQSEGMAAFIEKRAAELHPPLRAAMSEPAGSHRHRRPTSRGQGRAAPGGAGPPETTGGFGTTPSPAPRSAWCSCGFRMTPSLLPRGPLFQGLVSGYRRGERLRHREFSRCGWCVTCGHVIPARRHRAGRGWC